MTVGYIDPTGEITGDWDYTPNWQMVDDAVRQPTKVTTTMIRANHGDENDVVELTFETLANVDVVTEIKMWYLSWKRNRGADTYSWINGGWQNHYLTQATGSPDWNSQVLAGGPFDQADIDALKWKAIGNPSYRGAPYYDYTQFYIIYYEITYTELPLGYGHDFMGVPAANIDNVSGVPTANIDKIKGA